MMEYIKGGYLDLALVGLIFLALQIWWISMTIRNESNERIRIKQNQTDEIKNQLEKLFRKP